MDRYSLLSFVNDIRLTLRDNVGNNRLIEGSESEDYEIIKAMEEGIRRFNGTPPPSSFTFDNFPDMRILKLATLVEILRMKGIIYSRNSLSYADGDIQIEELVSKPQEYMMWIKDLMQELIIAIDAYKIPENIKEGFGLIRGGWKPYYL